MVIITEGWWRGSARWAHQPGIQTSVGNYRKVGIIDSVRVMRRMLVFVVDMYLGSNNTEQLQTKSSVYRVI